MSQPLSVLKSSLGLAKMLDAGLTGRVLDLSLIMQGGSMAAFSPILRSTAASRTRGVPRSSGGNMAPVFYHVLRPH